MLKRWKKNLILYGFILYFFNNIMISPWYVKKQSNTNLFNQSIIKKSKAEEWIIYFDGTDEEKTYSYLRLSAILTDNIIKYDSSMDMFPHSKQTDVALSRGIGDCEQFSEFTYTNFLYFTRATSNLRLRKNVRLCTGYSREGEKYKGHEWLEFMFNGEWKPLESTSLNGIGRRYVHKPTDTLLDSIDTKLQTFTPSEYVAFSQVSVDEYNAKTYYPNIFCTLIEPRGLVYRMLIPYD